MDISAFFGQYDQAIWTAVFLMLFNAAVQALPAPDLVAPSKAYVFFYNFAHGIAMNIGLIAKQSKNRTIVQGKIQGTGGGTGSGSVPEKKQAVREAKKEILDISAAKLDEETAGPLVGGAAGDG